MEERMLLVCFLLFVVTIINAQPPVQTSGSEIPLLATLGVAGISAGVTSAVLSAGIQNLRSDLETCEQAEGNLASTYGELNECLTNLNEKVNELEDCQKDLKECEEALAQRQAELEKTEADLKTCTEDYNSREDFKDDFEELYPEHIFCALKPSKKECDDITGCSWKDDTEFCERIGTVIVTK